MLYRSILCSYNLLDISLISKHIRAPGPSLDKDSHENGGLFFANLLVLDMELLPLRVTLRGL